MKKLIFFLLFTISLSAQIKGKIVDEKNNPIAYVNIWVENENIGTTSEENGDFTINTTKNKKLVFSAMGFQKIIISGSDAQLVILKTSEFVLNEVVIQKKFETKQLEIGWYDSAVAQAFDNGPRIDVKFFPYETKYKRTKFIKKVTINLDNKIENGTIKIHFYKVTEKGFPGEEMLKKDFLVTLKTGAGKRIINVLDLNLKMPLNGLFVGFEKLLIEKNKIETTIFNANNNTSKLNRTYYPLLLYNYIEGDYQYTFSGGNWNREPKEASKNKIMVFEPAIYLTLTN